MLVKVFPFCSNNPFTDKYCGITTALELLELLEITLLDELIAELLLLSCSLEPLKELATKLELEDILEELELSVEKIELDISLELIKLLQLLLSSSLLKELLDSI